MQVQELMWVLAQLPKDAKVEKIWDDNGLGLFFYVYDKENDKILYVSNRGEIIER